MTEATVTQAAPRPRGESESVYAAMVAGIAGAILGFVLGTALETLPLTGEGSLSRISALATGITAAVAATVGYLRTLTLDADRWASLPAWRKAVTVGSVVLVHAVLAALFTYVAFLVLGRAFIGIELTRFWSVVLSAVALGLIAHWAYGSVARLDTRKMSSLLLTFVVVGVFASMATSPDPEWWKVHFSHLGTFRHISSLLFNGTLVVSGLLVSSFVLYLSQDVRGLTAAGRLSRKNSVQIVTTLFLVLGGAFAGVGLVPVNISLLFHNLFAFTLGIVFILLLVLGPWVLRGLPKAYFIASGGILLATVLTVILANTGFFGVTALEVIIFSLIFGWLTLFMGFLDAARTSPDPVATPVAD